MGKRNPFTASERRGIIIVAIAALLVTGIGAVLSYMPPSTSLTDNELENVISNDSVTPTNSSNIKKKSSVKKRTKKEKKTFRKRSPLDEEV